ncbi:unnamed protein product [Clonostachys byssicola]|uniref:Fungal N-terminal domain-containing protein n=1 Tax=Clonostachys byssicola TaxID=160290 RepID=A0A9N9YAA3_9HYPO|nr:unnamed protein product [Clonostachys byssicola]
MDPVTIFGAVAGGVQLLDASIKTSKKCRSLISTFRHAEEFVEHLDRAMKEAEGLMADLQIFAMAAQKIPQDQLNQYGHVLTSSLGQIAWNYSNDLKCLAKLLPSPSSINFKEKFSFCRDQKAINNIILRLEQRKIAATLALGVLGRVKDLKNHAISLELEKSMRELSLEQSRLSEEFTRSVIAGTEQGRKTASTLLQIQRDVELRSTELQTSLASMETIAATRYSQLATKSQVTTIAASSVNQLGKIVRLELKRQFEPLKSRLDITDKMIDELATEVATHSHDQKVFESQKPEQGTQEHLPDQSLENVNFGSSGHSYIMMGNPKVSPSRRKVILSTYACSRYIGFGTLDIVIATYRTKTSPIQSSQPYFRLKIDFTPSPWLFSRGLSLLYSSEPSTDGYFNICPRLRVFGVICDDSPIDNMIQQDDVISFRRALDNHEVGIWDVNDGMNLLRMAVYSNSIGIAHYLLSTECAETLLTDGNLAFSECVQELLACIPDLEIGHQFLSSMRNLFDPNDQGELEDYHLIWNHFWSMKRSPFFFYAFREHAQSLEARQCVTLSNEYGIFLQPEHFLGRASHVYGFHHCFDQVQYLMALYLATDGNPNHKFDDGYPLLVQIFRQIGGCIFCHFSHIMTSSIALMRGKKKTMTIQKTLLILQIQVATVLMDSPTVLIALAWTPTTKIFAIGVVTTIHCLRSQQIFMFWTYGKLH